MCGRYTLYQTGEMPKRFKLATTSPVIHVDDNYNVAPGQFLPVITMSEQGRQAELMKWGLIPHWAKDSKIGYKLINARAETIFEKPMWRASATHYRCLVPARGFYEWKVLGDGKTKQPYYIHPKNMDMFAFAGLWSTWKDAEGYDVKSFSIITTEPNKEMQAVHNRMPVILRPEEEDRWLESSLGQEEIAFLMHPFEDNGLTMYEVSRDVNTTRTNDQHLIGPINSQ